MNENTSQRKLRILWHVQSYLPVTRCGSDWNAHEINKWMMRRGHVVKVMTSIQNRENYEHEGVHVFNRSHDWYHHHEWADLIFTHLDFAGDVAKDCRQSKKPSVWFAHNTFTYTSVRSNRQMNVVYNSHWNSWFCKYENNGFTLPCPVDIDYYKVVPGDKIGLINLNRNKGAELFYQIAERMPHKQFIGVQGSYGDQVYKQLPNVSLLANQIDIRNAYRRIGILLMPSKYESWGRTATEAMASGIPCIVSDLPGLRENCGDAGTYCNPDKIEDWISAVENVSNNYEICKAKALQRADELRYDNNLLNFEKWLMTLS